MHPSIVCAYCMQMYFFLCLYLREINFYIFNMTDLINLLLSSQRNLLVFRLLSLRWTEMRICFSSVGASAKSQRVGKETYKQSNEWHKHQSLQQPEWLLILEITTGVLVVVFIITGAATAAGNCKLKRTVKIPWKKSKNWRAEVAMSVG